MGNHERRLKIGEATDPLRGLWRCRTTDLRIEKQTTAYKWVKTGVWNPPPIEGCGNWNVYIGQKPYIVGRHVTIDAMCKRCSRRVKFQHSRRDNRGTVSPAIFLMRPHHMPRKALIEEMKARNRRVALDHEIEGFVKASELI